MVFTVDSLSFVGTGFWFRNSTFGISSTCEFFVVRERELQIHHIKYGQFVVVEDTPPHYCHKIAVYSEIIFLGGDFPGSLALTWNPGPWRFGSDDSPLQRGGFLGPIVGLSRMQTQDRLTVLPS